MYYYSKRQREGMLIQHALRECIISLQGRRIAMVGMERPDLARRIQSMMGELEELSRQELEALYAEEAEA